MYSIPDIGNDQVQSSFIVRDPPKKSNKFLLWNCRITMSEDKRTLYLIENTPNSFFILTGDYRIVPYLSHGTGIRSRHLALPY